MLGPLSPTLTRLLLLVTFLESLGAVLLQRGLYFYTSAIHGFSGTQNLWLAFAQGGSYVLGALGSHALAQRAGERRAMLGCLAALFVLHTTLAVMPSASLITLAFPLIGMMQGLKWPLVESYASAGHNPQALLALVGRYNVAWALAIPLALMLVGALIGASAHRAFFALPASINALALGLVQLWPARPGRLADDHPERPNQATIVASTALLVSSRWTMLSSYLLLFLLAPLMPDIFRRLELAVRLAPSAAALLDVLRLSTFALLGAWPGWRGRRLPLVVAGIALPISFFMVLFAENVAVVLLGEALFGVASGVAYYSALYYALLTKNASVDAGGAHEGMIGLGFALGPLAGLVGHALTDGVGGYVPAMLLSTLPLVVLFFAAALRPLAARPERA
jgi:MFS family permease